jgi:hypothetical protein
MKELLSQIIIAILEGKDYRPFVLATINKRFVDTAYVLLDRVYQAKKENKSIDWWLDNLIDKSTNRNEILWFGGLNAKTVTNMMGTAKKEVCVELGKENIRSLELLIKQFMGGEVPRMLVSIIFGNDKVELNELESLILVNTLAAMKLSIQGGAWSEVGKKTEKQLLYTVFELLSIKPSQYVLVFEEMKKRGLVENREIDAIVFSDDSKKALQVELKLLGIGNPEIADEALARKVGLFLIDRLTPMMIAEAAKIGVEVVELRGEGALDNVWEFFHSNNVSAIRPGKVNFDDRVPEILSKYDEQLESKKLLKKAKELTR